MAEQWDCCHCSSLFCFLSGTQVRAASFSQGSVLDRLTVLVILTSFQCLCVLKESQLTSTDLGPFPLFGTYQSLSPVRGLVAGVYSVYLGLQQSSIFKMEFLRARCRLTNQCVSQCGVTQWVQPTSQEMWERPGNHSHVLADRIKVGLI